ncbi:alanine--tRNA ligase-related protein [Aerosakkonema funiforme]|uniref:alanine--tRNA ligase n=2 Tax=Oscillatoriophycideae TaxID=1301283 RepID=A0A926ZFJ7_9CYAN|nr:alanine--tRNA ligase-related protein [Aerosakkonema funiforme]MBD2181208.1 hypothetical protein [Aerosakkonema funiforme FACHB-1375]
MNSNQIRQKFLSFYAARGHQILPTESLVANSPDLMFQTNLWTLPFHPISLGQRYSPSNHSTILQKHISPNLTVLTERHLTFFEILGNCGNYSQEQALSWAWELCTEVYQLPPERLVVSVRINDTETFAIWRDRIGVPEHRIIFSNQNFWRTRPHGHCGRNTRIHYDFYPERGYQSVASEEDIQFQSKDKEYYDRPDTLHYLLPEEDLRFLSFYHLVLMEFDTEKYVNKLIPLQRNYIDAGLAVEKLAVILQEVSNFYETDLIFPIIETVAEVAGVDYERADAWTKICLKVIADQIRAAVYLSADCVPKPPHFWNHPIRKQIKIWLMRVVLHAQLLGIEHPFVKLPIATTITLGEKFYPLLRQQQNEITAFLQDEESYCWKQLQTAREKGIVTGRTIEQFFHTYDCSIKDIQRWATQQSLTLDFSEYNAILGPEID